MKGYVLKGAGCLSGVASAMLLTLIVIPAISVIRRRQIQVKKADLQGRIQNGDH